MKHFLRIVLATFIIAFVAGAVTTGCSCQKAGGGDNPNNSGGGNGGDGGDGNNGGDGGSDGDGNGGNGGNGGSGDGSGGGTPAPDLGADIKITVSDANLAKIKDGTNILLKLSAWPTAVADSDVHFGEIITRGSANTRKKAFEIVNKKATEGLLLVVRGNIAGPNDAKTRGIGAFDGRTTLRAFNGTAADDLGIRAISTATANGNVPAGLSYISIFASKLIPTADPTDNADPAPDAAPFAFTSIPTGFWPAQPIFYCIATAPALTATVAATDKLVGAHKADCYVTSVGASFGNVAADAARRTQWFTAADPFKREIKVAIVALKTDGKTIADLMPGANDNAKVENLKDGIDANEMRAISAVNGDPPFKKINIKIVNDADFAAP